MNRCGILALAIVFSSVLIVSASNICNNEPCEPQINASLGKEFTIALESNPSISFEWWTNFDPNYLTLLNSTFLSGNEKPVMPSVSGKKLFTFDTRNAGNTEVIMLLLRPRENGTIAERKIFPINIIPATAAPKQITLSRKIVNLEHPATTGEPAIMLGKSIGGMTTNPLINNQTWITSGGTSSTYVKNESVMETPSQIVSPQYGPSRYESSSLNQQST